MSPSSPSADDAPAGLASRWGSVKLRLAAIGALLIGMAVAFTVGLTIRTMDEREEQVALDLSLAQTRKMASMLGAHLVSLQITLRGGAEQFDTRGPIDAARARAFLSERSAMASQFATLFVANLNGEMLAYRSGGTVTTPNFKIGDRAYFQQTLAEGRPVISAATVGRGTAEPVVVLTLPVYGADGRIAVVLGGAIRLASHGLVTQVTRAEESDPALTVIVDAQGRVISHPDPKWLMRDATQQPALAGAMGHWTAQGRPIEPSGLAGRYDDQFVAMVGVPDADWMVVHAAAVDRVLAGGREAKLRALWVGGAVALGGGLLLLLATFFMLRPLREIERCSVQVMQGRAPAEVDWPRASNELGQLSNALRQALEGRHAADAAGRELLERLQAVMAHAPVGIAFTRNGLFEAVSAHLHRLFGYPPNGLVGQPRRVICDSDEFCQGLEARTAAAFAAGRSFDEEIEFVRMDGSHFWGRMQGQPVHSGDPGAGVIWTLEDVSAQRSHRESLAWAGSHDMLTRLVNRAEFERRLGASCRERRQSEPASALFIDLDRFKQVNDSAGHAAGDAVLVAVAAALGAQARQADTVARLGGDEFAVLLAGCDRAGAVIVAEKMRSAIDALRVSWAGELLSVGASVGVVELDPSFGDAASALAAADAACYAAKRAGRNSVRVHGALPDPPAPAALRLVRSEG